MPSVQLILQGSLGSLRLLNPILSLKRGIHLQVELRTYLWFEREFRVHHTAAEADQCRSTIHLQYRLPIIVQPPSIRYTKKYNIIQTKPSSCTLWFAILSILKHQMPMSDNLQHSLFSVKIKQSSDSSAYGGILLCLFRLGERHKGIIQIRT